MVLVSASSRLSRSVDGQPAGSGQIEQQAQCLQNLPILAFRCCPCLPSHQLPQEPIAGPVLIVWVVGCEKNRMDDAERRRSTKREPRPGFIGAPRTVTPITHSPGPSPCSARSTPDVSARVQDHRLAGGRHPCPWCACVRYCRNG